MEKYVCSWFQEFNMFCFSDIINTLTKLSSLLHNKLYAISLSLFFFLGFHFIKFHLGTTRIVTYFMCQLYLDMFYCQRCVVVFYAFIFFYLTENCFQIIIMLSVMSEFTQRMSYADEKVYKRTVLMYLNKTIHVKGKFLVF